MARVADLQEVHAATKGFDGGVNIRDAPNQLAENECRVLENVVLDERGGASKRLGCVSQGTFGVAGDRVLAMYTFYRGATAPQVLIHTSGGKLYYTNDPTANPTVWTQIATGLSTSQRFSFETFNNMVFFSNGVDNYASWDGATYTTYPSAPKGRYLRLFKDAMWVSGVPGLQDRVYESNAGDATTFGVASWVDIAKGDGDQVKGLGSDGLFLIVGKRNRISVIYDPVTLANRMVDFEKGLESHFSIIQSESQLFFLSRRGICQWLGDTPSRYISYRIDPLFDPSILNLNALENAYAYTAETRVCWAVPEVGSAVPTLQIEYYPRLGPLSQYTGNRGIGPFSFSRIPAQAFTLYRWQTVEWLLAGHNAANKMLRLLAPVGTDDGATFQGLLETGAFDFGSPDRDKYIRRMRFLGRGKFQVQMRRNFLSAIYKSYTVDLTATTDTWSTATTWNTGTWGPDSVVKEKMVNTDLYGRHFAIRVVDAETGIGTKPVSAGSVDRSLTAGEWGLYGAQLDGELLGMRSK